MDTQKTAALIRRLRNERGLTQAELAELLHVSAKAVSKWECGRGAPELSLLPGLAKALNTDMSSLLKGEMEENDMSGGNFNKLKFYVCPDCGNIIYSTESAEVHCCGRTLPELKAAKANDMHGLTVESSDGDWYITSAHPMTREHYISFVAFQNADSLVVKKLYPQWGMELRLPYFAHGRLVFYCVQDGLFWMDI